MTSDSRLCNGCSSNLFQILQSSVDPVLLLPDCSSPSNRLPRPPGVKYRMVLLHPSDSSHCWLIQLIWLHYTHLLCSIGFHRLRHYYEVFRPLVPHSYSRPRGSNHL